MATINVYVIEECKTFDEIFAACVTISHKIRSLGVEPTSIIMRPDQKYACMALATAGDYRCDDGVDTFLGLTVRVE